VAVSGVAPSEGDASCRGPSDQPQARAATDAALVPKPNTSKPAPGHKIFPYLLRGLAIERVNQLWAADISGAAFLYLVAIIDWASRAVLSCGRLLLHSCLARSARGVDGVYNHGRLHQALDCQAPTAVRRDEGFKYAPEVPAGALRPLIQIKREMVDGRPSRDFFLRSLW